MIMYNYSNYGMGNKVAAANNNNGVSANNNTINNNNNAETLKGLIIAGHDGAKDFGSGENGMDFNFAWGEYKIFVVRSYGVWKMRIYKNWLGVGRFDANLTPNWGGIGFDRRWSKSLVENMATTIEKTIADYETESETAREIAMHGAMTECVDRYQSEVDGYVEDLRMISDNYDGIKTKMDAFAVMCVFKKIKQVCDDCLVAVGEISGCDMVWDDGYHVDLSELSRWMGNYGSMDDNYAYYAIENDIVAIDCMITESDMPLGSDNPFEDDDWEETLEKYYDGDVENFFQIFEEELVYTLYEYPIYLWESLAEFSRTYVHYAYCA